MKIMDPITAAAISEGTKQTTKSLVDRLVNPIIDGIKLAYNKNLVLINEHFQEYLLRNYEKYSTMNTLVFSNAQKLLKDIYIPLSITCYEARDRKELTKKIDTYPKDIINKYRKLLVIDTAGMGKSTMMKYIYLSIIDNGEGIPIFIELRRLNANKDILDEVQEQLNALNKEFDEVLLKEFIKDGKLIFILDGYDEIPLTDKGLVTEKMQEFIAKASNNLFFMTSRPEDALSCFGDFVRFEINPLIKDEAFELLRKYDNTGKTSELLINKLKDEESESIEEFLKNPLLVSLLYTAFDFKQTIPLKKHLFYRQVFDAFFEVHDLSKGDSFARKKHSKLDIDEFHRVLRYIGFKSIKKIEFSKDELLSIIKDSKTFCIGVNFSESDFLNDLLMTVPIFVKDGIYYKWAHKSLQEYFAAQFIFLDAKQAQSEILNRLYNGNDLDKYFNLLDLYYNIDYKGFREIITCNLLTEYKKFCSIFIDNKISKELKTIYSIIFNGIPIFCITSSKNFSNGVSLIEKEGEKETAYNNIYSQTQLPSEFVIFHPKGKYSLVYSQYSNKKSVILKILSNESFIFKSKASSMMELNGFIENENFRKDIVYVIDISNENPLTIKGADLFIPNDFLEHLNMHFSNYYIDYDKALKELSQIENEKAIDNIDSLLKDI